MAYEQVSPADKGDGGVGGGGSQAGYKVTADGKAAFYPANSAFAGAEGFLLANPYFARRSDDGWSTTAVGWAGIHTPSLLGGSPGPNPFGVSQLGGRTLLVSDRDPNTGEEVPLSLFLEDAATGERKRLTPDPLGDPDEFMQFYGGGDSTFENVYFWAQLPYTQEAKDAADDGVSIEGGIIYHWSEERGLSVASRETDGSVRNGALAVMHATFSSDVPGRNFVSEDGEVYFYYSAASGTLRSLYRGELGNPASTLVTVSENPAVPSPGRGAFVGASKDGRLAFFTSDQALIEDLPPGNYLYMYDHSKPEGSRLTNLSENSVDPMANPGVTRALGVSDDGRIAYFVAGGQLTPDAPAGVAKLYKWVDGEGVSYIETIAPSTFNAVTGPSYISPDGGYVMFRTATSIGDVDTGGKWQVYVYDNGTDTLSCASCVRGGTNQHDAAIEVFANTLGLTHEGRRYVNDNGQVFFMTADRLLDRDTNGVQDVYMWQKGQLHLISTGRDPYPSTFADASVDGSAVFFVTNEQLTPSDRDQQRDLYAARVNGGLATADEAGEEAPCSGDACQGQAPGSPAAPSVTTEGSHGRGNVQPGAKRPRFVVNGLQVRGAAGAVRVRANHRGRLIVRGSHLRVTRKAIGKAGVHRVRVALKPKARRVLARRGSIRVAARLTLRTNQGNATRVVRITFRRGGGR